MKILRLFLIAGFLISISAYSQTEKKIITLEEAMNIALDNSPNIKKARLSMEQQKEYLKAQLASLKSRFQFNVTPFNYSKTQTYDDFSSTYYNSETKSSRGNFSVSQPVKFTDGTILLRNDFGYRDNTTTSGTGRTTKAFDNNLYIQYEQPLFKYNKTRMDLKKVELNLENATYSYAIEMLSLERMVNQSFYAIYQKQKSLEIAKEELANQEKSFEIIKSKVKGDLSAREELFQAELNLATSNSNCENKLVELENSMDDFKKLLGISLYEEITVFTDIEYKKVDVNLKKAIENGLANRMELIQREIDITRARFDLIETSANNSFNGNIRLSYGLSGNSKKLFDVYDNPTKSPQVSVTFSIPIFDWGARKARIKAAELAIESREIDLNSLRNDIIINIRKIYRNLNNLIRQIEIAEQNEKNAQLTYEINLERYQNGDLTSMDLKIFQNQLTTKKMNRTDALINYKLELLNLKIQTLWDFENNTSFVPLEFQSNISAKSIK
jgi:outer membrane protein TolC